MTSEDTAASVGLVVGLAVGGACGVILMSAISTDRAAAMKAEIVERGYAIEVSSPGGEKVLIWKEDAK